MINIKEPVLWSRIDVFLVDVRTITTKWFSAWILTGCLPIRYRWVNLTLVCVKQTSARIFNEIIHFNYEIWYNCNVDKISVYVLFREQNISVLLRIHRFIAWETNNPWPTIIHLSLSYFCRILMLLAMTYDGAKLRHLDHGVSRTTRRSGVKQMAFV